MERITDIFLYQMERKYKDKVKWKIVHKILNKMIWFSRHWWKFSVSADWKNGKGVL